MTISRQLVLPVLLGLATPTVMKGQCSGVKGGRVGAIAGVFVAGEALAIGVRHNDWWTPPRRSFHVISRGSPSKGQDALLHGSISYQASQGSALAWDWACVPHTTAGWLGAALGFALGIPKEIGDGLHQNGFSIPDMTWTAAGSLLPAFHRQWPATRAVQLKVFYWPSEEYRNRTGKYPQLENDYAGQRYFLSFNPGRADVSWPRWLGVAGGHSVPYWTTQPPIHEWYLALDLDFRGLPIHAPWWKRVATVLDQGHVPMPGVRIRNGEVGFGLF